jgi:hypothetical protein
MSFHLEGQNKKFDIIARGWLILLWDASSLYCPVYNDDCNAQIINVIQCKLITFIFSYESSGTLSIFLLIINNLWNSHKRVVQMNRVNFFGCQNCLEVYRDLVDHNLLWLDFKTLDTNFLGCLHEDLFKFQNVILSL